MRLAAAPVRVQSRRQGLFLQLRRRGQRGRDQAGAQGQAGRGRSRRARRFPRAHLRRPVGHTPGVKAGPLRAARARLQGGRPNARGARRARSTSAPRSSCSSRSKARQASMSSPTSLLRRAREACDACGGALVFDEIQCGMGRTGTLWAYEQTGVVPDAITSAKALGGGLPIGALITGPRLADVFQPGDHGSTFAGGPAVAAAALAVLDVTSEPALRRPRAGGGRLLARAPGRAAPRPFRQGPRPDARLRGRCPRARCRRAALCYASAWSSTPRAPPRFACCRPSTYPLRSCKTALRGSARRSPDKVARRCVREKPPARYDDTLEIGRDD